MTGSEPLPPGSFPLKNRFRLLLINPRFPESFWSFRFAIKNILPRKRALNPPLGLATLAALCPPEWDITIIDENVEPLPMMPEADLIGICGMGVQFARQSELLNFYKNQGYYVVAGGSYASLCPERYTDLADTIIAGEAEYIWPVFCQDFLAGKANALYQESGIVAIADSPTPRFDLLKLDRYTAVSMQFSRGCPYRCEFCDIIVMFGRKPRTKTTDQIGRELDKLRVLGVRNIFFVDDNLIGNKKKAKELLAYIRDYQHIHQYWFSFGTEASLNLAEDQELMTLFHEARFGWVFIGIESPDEASLREMKKSQNLRGNLLESIITLYRNGIDVMAGFIVGFDNDTLDTFDRQHRFITQSGIQLAMVGLLTALPKTPLYLRLEKEGRLIKDAPDGNNTGAATNLIPLHMNYDEMVARYKQLYRRLQTDAGIGSRIESKIRYLNSPIYNVQYTNRERLTILYRLLTSGILPGGPARLGWFVRTLFRTRVRVWPQVITDWITGLAMRDYVDRHFQFVTIQNNKMVEKYIRRLRDLGREGLNHGTLGLSVSFGTGCHYIELTLRGYSGQRFLRQAGHKLDRLLRKTTVTLVLRVESLAEEQLDQMQNLLQLLSRHGDRIFIHLNNKLMPLIYVDSSVFNLMLSDPGNHGQTGSN
ncbi:MAG: radical SAM protein [Gammaproteobacteria bacterium]|nr:radical SAM protein [Gammaproteobacteria bacterium]